MKQQFADWSVMAERLPRIPLSWCYILSCVKLCAFDLLLALKTPSLRPFWGERPLLCDHLETTHAPHALDTPALGLPFSVEP